MIDRPPVHLDHNWHFPTPTVSRLDNGLAIWHYQLPGQYVVTANLVIDLPLSAEPPEHEGVATICVRGLDEGSEAHPGVAFSAALEQLGAAYGGWAGQSATVAQLEVPADWFTAGLAVFAEGVMTPAYADEDVARLVANRLAELDQLRAASAQLASWLIRSSLFGLDQRLGRLIGGHRASVTGLTAELVRQFHAGHYSPSQATLVVAGDIGQETVVEATQAAFGDWQPAGLPSVHETPRAVSPRQRLIHRPGAVQADIRLGLEGLPHDHPQWAGLQVACAILGEGFASRLNQELREQRGWTYDVSLGHHSLRRGGYLTLGTSTQTANTAELLERTYQILALSGGGFTPAEAQAAVGLLTGVAPLSFSTAEAVANQAASLASRDWPTDTPEQAFQAIARVTAQEAEAAWREVVDIDQLTLVVLGDADELTKVLGIEPEPLPEL